MDHLILPIYSELTFELLVAILGSAIIGWLVLMKHLGPQLALMLVLTRAFFSLAYIGWFFNADWWLEGDSNNYIRSAQFLLNTFEKIRSIEFVLMLSTQLDQPAAYVLHNFLSFKVFGEHFFAPLILNMVLVFFCAALLFSLTKGIIYQKEWRKGLVCFFVLHPSTLAWSSFSNTKEVLVLTCILAITFFSSELIRGVKRYAILIPQSLLNFSKKDEGTRAIHESSVYVAPSERAKDLAKSIFFVLAIGVSFFILSNTRKYLIYIVPLLGLGWSVWVLGLYCVRVRAVGLFSLSRVSFGVVILCGVLGIGALFVLVARIPHGYFEYLQTDINVRGIATMFLAPKPWSLSYEYGFLFVPAMIHWIFFGWSLIGLWLLAGDSDLGRWFFVYAVGILVIFGLTPEVLGPRHRFQTEFVFVLAQYLVLFKACTIVGYTKGYRNVRTP
jgi:hypothetical protein